jgi:hypothetical protein
MDAYVDWREESASVWDAYERFAQAHGADVSLAFFGYRAALDREECASRVYAGLIDRIASAHGRRTERVVSISEAGES